MIEVIGVPFDLCGRRSGARLGPSAIRFAGLVPGLEGLGLRVKDSGDLHVPDQPPAPGAIRNLEPLLELTRSLRAHVSGTLAAGRMPLILGGDHASGLGAVAAALERYGEDLALLWIDAHSDLNTPDTSPSGNLHGMPLAALLGIPSKAEASMNEGWARLLEAVGPKRLHSGRVAWLGLRDVDSGERPRVRKMKDALPITMHDIDRNGLVHELERLHEWLCRSGAERLWISFDVDALDPILAPGTGTAVRGGLSFREAHLVAELLFELMRHSDCCYKLTGVDLMEANPLCDTNNETAKVAAEWLGSLLGKTILGPR